MRGWTLISLDSHAEIFSLRSKGSPDIFLGGLHWAIVPAEHIQAVPRGNWITLKCMFNNDKT